MIRTSMHRTGALLALLLIASGLTALSSPATAAIRPDAPATRELGRTVKGRPIMAYRLGDPGAATRVVVIAAMHGNEAGPRRIIANLRRGPAIHGVEMWVVPSHNPDGVARRSRHNAHGVDLNRNYPVEWSRLTGHYYSGTGPASEPETQAIMRFLNEVDPQFVISFHQPLRSVGSAPAKGRAFVRRLSRGLRLPVKSLNCSSQCHGTMTEWFNARHDGVAVTVEYGSRMSRRQARRSGPRGVLRAVHAWREPATR